MNRVRGKRLLCDSSEQSTSTASYATDSSDGSDQCCNWNNIATQRRKKTTPSEGEMAVINDLNALSMNERERVYEEIHGIKQLDTVHETPELIEDALVELDEHLAKMKRNKKTAYELARLMSPAYVKRPKFLLMFLRSEMFSIPKTATRLVAHFQVKLDLFGVDKLIKDITWYDLSHDDRAAVLNCSSQNFPNLKDNAGRTVWVAAMGKDVYKTEDNHLRCSWYSIMGIVQENEHAQKNGIVGIADMIGLDSDKFHNALAARAMAFLGSAPFRYAALHICYDNPRLKPAISLIQLLTTSQTRVRFRAHFGTHMECQYEIMAFGINPKTFPITPSGELRTDEYLAFLAQRQQREAEAEEAAKASSKILYPLSNDVLFGRGKSYNDFAGNVKMYEYIDRYKSRYQQSVSKDEKTVLSEMVLMMVKESGGRFLKRAKAEEDGWVAVSDTVARDKISHTFRTRLR